MQTPSAIDRARSAVSTGTDAADVVVIGGGPAGTSTATELADRGYRVVLLEKDHHPRFHIGESLLPANLPLLERLGVGAEVRAIGMQKWGAEFVNYTDGREQVFEFADSWNKSQAFAYQVRRSQFDEILIRNSARHGVVVHEGCRVRVSPGSIQRWKLLLGWTWYKEGHQLSSALVETRG